DAAARAAVRREAGRLEHFPHPGKLVPLTAIKTLRIGAIAMQLYDFLGRNAGVLRKIVDILRDAVSALPLIHQLRTGHVALVGFCLRNRPVDLAFSPPRFRANIGSTDKVLKVYRRHFRPESAWAAEIGNAAFRADAR